jgi:hypothetical protein
MRACATSVLILAWLILGCGTFLDQSDGIELNKSPFTVLVQDNDDDADDAKKDCSLSETADSFSADYLGRLSCVHYLSKTFDLPSHARYQLFSVYRL